MFQVQRSILPQHSAGSRRPVLFEVQRDGAKVRELQLDVAEREAELERANEEWANWS
jgi:hypothetical protein